MSEQEYRELFRKDCDEKIKPLVEQVTSLIMKAYEYGLDLGLSTANQIIESKQSSWKDQCPSVDTVKKIVCYALKHTNIMLAEDLENGVEWELLIKKAMED